MRWLSNLLDASIEERGSYWKKLDCSTTLYSKSGGNKAVNIRNLCFENLENVEDLANETVDH